MLIYVFICLYLFIYISLTLIGRAGLYISRCPIKVDASHHKGARTLGDHSDQEGQGHRFCERASVAPGRFAGGLAKMMLPYPFIHGYLLEIVAENIQSLLMELFMEVNGNEERASIFNCACCAQPFKPRRRSHLGSLRQALRK